MSQGHVARSCDLGHSKKLKHEFVLDKCKLTRPFVYLYLAKKLFHTLCL